jgi:hypothetical protein
VKTWERDNGSSLIAHSFRSQNNPPNLLAKINTNRPFPGSSTQDVSMVSAEGQQYGEDSAETGPRTTVIDTTFHGKSPSLAILLSAVLPGAGQVYVHRYITIPIIWGLGYYFVSSWQHQNHLYFQYRDSFARSVEQDTVKHQGDSQLLSARDFYRDDRDKFAFYIAITYILNVVDAYVGASLYSFDVSDNLGGSAALRVRIPIR